MFLPTKRTEGVSTSDLILRVLKDYDDYIYRNLQKKYTPESLGISHEYAQYVKLKRAHKDILEKRSATAPSSKPEEPSQRTEKVRNT